MRVYWTLACLVAAIVSSAFLPAYGEDENKDCEVCIKVLEEVKESIIAQGLDSTDKEVIELAVDKFCAKKIHRREEKMCYYLKPIKKHISHPFSLGLPMDKVCKRLKAGNSEICDVKYPIKVADENVDYGKMRVKQLREILNDRGVECVACTEKSEYIEMVKKTNNLEL